MKNKLQRDNQKGEKKIQHNHIFHYSLKQNSENQKPEAKKNKYIFKAKDRNNMKTMVLKIYLQSLCI